MKTNIRHGFPRNQLWTLPPIPKLLGLISITPLKLSCYWGSLGDKSAIHIQCGRKNPLCRPILCSQSKMFSIQCFRLLNWRNLGGRRLSRNYTKSWSKTRPKVKHCKAKLKVDLQPGNTQTYLTEERKTFLNCAVQDRMPFLTLVFKNSFRIFFK